MSRLSRQDAAKSVIAIWRWLHEQPDAPDIKGNHVELLARLPDNLPHVSKESEAGLTDRIKLLDHLGLVKHTVTHEGRPGQPGVARSGGSTFVGLTTIVERDIEKGAREIGKHFARGGYLKVNAKGNQRLNGTAQRPVDPEKVAIQTDEKERPIAAIVGPDAPTLGEGLREAFVSMQTQEKDESAALVAAARQYNSRQEFVFERLGEMEKLGIMLDREKVMRGIKLQRDDELEGIVKVLPYIDQMEARVKQAEGWREQVISVRDEIKIIRRERDEARLDAQRQREANKRITERHAQEAVSAKSQVLVG